MHGQCLLHVSESLYDEPDDGELSPKYGSETPARIVVGHRARRQGSTTMLKAVVIMQKRNIPRTPNENRRHI